MSGIDILARQGTRESPELIELMRQQVEHLVRLVDDLLDLSRITRDRVELKRQEVELGPLLERSVAAMRTTLDEREQTVAIGFHLGEAAGRVDDGGDVLASGDEKGSEAVGDMSVVADAGGMEMSGGGGAS